MKQIQLTQDQIALVDDQDYEWLNQWRWYARKGRYTFYAVRHVCVTKGKRRQEQMHRLILELQPDDKRECDHRDGNGLNNRRSNLRICTMAQNQRSRRNQMGCTSRFKGVWWHRGNRNWQSRIGINGKQICLGSFNSETEAAQAYDKAALKHHGDFRLTNEMLGLL